MNGPEESKPPAAPEASAKNPTNARPRAPKPITTLSGTGGYSFTPKPSKVPHDPPIYFPRDLWAETNLILLKAQRAFPLQEQALQLCKRVISDMTPLFADVVKAGKIKADAVQKRDGGGMEDLLRLLLMCNDGGVKSGFGGLSDTAYDLGEKVRDSEEWLAMAEAIVDAQQCGAQPSSTPETGKPAQYRAKVTEAIVNELKTIKPKMHNEAHFERVKAEHPTFSIFKIANDDADVRRWIENIQERRDVVKLAQEISARYFNKPVSTLATDWSHRKKPRKKVL